MAAGNEMSSSAVGTRLYYLRTKAGESQKDAGRLIGVSLPTYAKIERGWRPLKPREAAIFAEHYGVDVRWIVCGLSPKECEVVDVIRKPESVPTPHVATPFVWSARKVG